MNWNDLSYLLAVMRGQSLGRAARLLDVDKTTVSRRLAALERELGAALAERTPDGRLVLTQLGQAAATEAERMEAAETRIRSLAGQGHAVEGRRARLTAVPLLINRVLLPAVPDLTDRQPGLAVELIADARDLSLIHRDADIAVRLARPRDGGHAVLARNIGQLRYGAFVATDAPDDLPWIGYDEGMQHLDPARAIARLAARPGERLSPLRVNDGETLCQAVLDGQGRSLLPRLVAAPDARLREVHTDFEPPVRGVWLLIRRDLRGLAHVDGVVAWLEGLFGDEVRDSSRAGVRAG